MSTQLQQTQPEDILSRITALEPFTLIPVGIVSSPVKKPVLRADEEGISQEEQDVDVTEHHRKRKTTISEIWINPELEGILDGIDGFSHIMVLYWPHLVDEERRKLLKVHPMGRKDIPRQGIYATCSPARPNPVLVTAVRLLERRDNMLRVQGSKLLRGARCWTSSLTIRAIIELNIPQCRNGWKKFAMKWACFISQFTLTVVVSPFSGISLKKSVNYFWGNMKHAHTWRETAMYVI